MKLHRNSQKRFYERDYVYFVTGVTKDRFPYFEEGVFCEVFWENLKICEKMKGFELYGWFLGYDHFHILLMPGEEFNVSKVMQFLKRHVSRNINEVMNFEGDIGQCRLQNGPYSKYELMIDLKNKKLKSLQQEFHQKYPQPHLIPYPKFQWQKSFHDHVIRNERDFEAHMKYIEYNPLKHGMPEGWKWSGFND